ncbi:MAG: IS1634 family transposase, partial [Gammaproteobacteria bacterium]|nr:IS1634 family transposase [Gammaproteobacteria bacterium]
MAAHIETGTMISPTYSSKHYRSLVINHLGLVAGMYDELGIGELIDRLISQDSRKRTVSIGQAIKAMILNGLGFAHRALYLSPLFFSDKPVERLIGRGIEAEHLNDDVLGRALDDVYDYGPDILYSQISALAVKRLDLSARFGHLDSTGFHTDGNYNSAEEPEEGVVQITKGYSRDHRPDLNQVCLQLVCEQQAGMPLLMKPLSGNNDDKTSFRDTINAHIEQMKGGFGIKYVIADSAFYTAQTLKLMGKDNLWISRVPETLNLATDIIHAVAPNLMSDVGQSAYVSLGAEYGDIKQRWVVVYSPEAYQRGLKTVKKNCLSQSNAKFKAFRKLCKQDFACEADAHKALVAFSQGRQKITFVADAQVIAVPRYEGKGRPAQDRKPDFYVYRIEGGIASIPTEKNRRIERKSCFILASNQLNQEELSDKELIDAYKDQQKVERGFRFLKDPMFMASTLFLKSPKRIMALMMLMTVCLLVYAALEFRIRDALKTQSQSFPNQKGKSII